MLSFSKTKKASDSEENLFQKQFIFNPPRNKDGNLDHQIDVQISLNLEKLEKKSKCNLSKMEQKNTFKIKE